MFATHPVPGQCRTFVYVYVSFLSLKQLQRVTEGVGLGWGSPRARRESLEGFHSRHSKPLRTTSFGGRLGHLVDFLLTGHHPFHACTGGGVVV